MNFVGFEYQKERIPAADDEAIETAPDSDDGSDSSES